MTTQTLTQTNIISCMTKPLSKLDGLPSQVEESHELCTIAPPVAASPTPTPRNEILGRATPERPHDLHDQTSRLPFGRLLSAYFCLAAIYFISSLDINSVATALPAISRTLGGGSSITWTGTSYLMGQTAFQVLYGRLSDIFGRKPVLLICVGFLVVGDLLCGFAQNVTWLYVCRALSGVGGGGISSLVQITVSDLVSLKDRGKYQGMLSGAIGLGSSTGPFIAASILRHNDSQSWRWIFWVPPILASAGSILMWIFLPLKPVAGSWQDKLRKIDWFGLVVAVAGLVFLLSATLILPLLLLQSVAGMISGPLMTKLARYGPILYVGMAMWTLGAGLKVLFSRTTPISAIVIILVIEGTGIGFVLQPALVALQALSNSQDRAVATSTRNLMRMLGSVVGMAMSTTVQFAVMKSALPHNLPASIRSQVFDGSWLRGGPDSEIWESDILNAKMRGIQAVFIILVPLITLCLVGCLFIPNKELRGDQTNDDHTVREDARRRVEDSSRHALTRSV